MQQWYHHYQAAQAHTYTTAAPQDGTATDYSKEHAQVKHTPLDSICADFCIILCILTKTEMLIFSCDKTAKMMQINHSSH